MAYDNRHSEKDFTPSEAVAIWQALENYQGQNLGPIWTEVEPQRRDRAAAATGFGHSTLSRAKQVIDAAVQEPEKFGGLVETMDRTGKAKGRRTSL